MSFSDMTIAGRGLIDAPFRSAGFMGGLLDPRAHRSTLIRPRLSRRRIRELMPQQRAAYPPPSIYLGCFGTGIGSGDGHNAQGQANMDDFLRNPWRDDDVLLGGLAIANQALSALLENIAAVRDGDAEPLTAVQVASVGSSMIEAGNALLSRIVNSLPEDWPAPAIPR